jgi:hypothetical protein
MWGYDPLCFEDEFLKLEAEWIRPRTEKSVLIMKGCGTVFRMKELDEEEARAFSVMMDYRMARSRN